MLCAQHAISISFRSVRHLRRLQSLVFSISNTLEERRGECIRGKERRGGLIRGEESTLEERRGECIRGKERRGGCIRGGWIRGEDVGRQTDMYCKENIM
jgi:hypothetical protein